jgi:hypothetical protein
MAYTTEANLQVRFSVDTMGCLDFAANSMLVFDGSSRDRLYARLSNAGLVNKTCGGFEVKRLRSVALVSHVFMVQI